MTTQVLVLMKIMEIKNPAPFESRIIINAGGAYFLFVLAAFFFSSAIVTSYMIGVPMKIDA